MNICVCGMPVTNIAEAFAHAKLCVPDWLNDLVQGVVDEVNEEQAKSREREWSTREFAEHCGL